MQDTDRVERMTFGPPPIPAAARKPRKGPDGVALDTFAYPTPPTPPWWAPPPVAVVAPVVRPARLARGSTSPVNPLLIAALQDVRVIPPPRRWGQAPVKIQLFEMAEADLTVRVEPLELEPEVHAVPVFGAAIAPARAAAPVARETLAVGGLAAVALALGVAYVAIDGPAAPVRATAAPVTTVAALTPPSSPVVAKRPVVEELPAPATMTVTAQLAVIEPAVVEPVVVEPVVEPASAARATPPAAVASAAPARKRAPVAPTGPSAKKVSGGIVMIGSKPPCRILVDGKDTGLMTPQRELRLPAGKHVITLVNEEFAIDEAVTVTVDPATPVRVVRDLSEHIERAGS